MANETVQFLRVEVRLSALVTGSDGAQLVKTISYDKTLTDGTGTDQVGAVWTDDSDSLASTTTTKDLDGLTDFKGATMSDNTGVKVLCIINNETATGKKLVVGGGDWAGTGSFLVDASDKCNVGPGGILLAVNPIDSYTITASTGDGLLLDSGSNTVAFTQLYGFKNA